ncbi:MAG: nuclear transport factor 2 family protein [Acidobacteria bacterium]|nr:nuclear transport factor 2 family protein [Acidobacteriota bacterium]
MKDILITILLTIVTLSVTFGQTNDKRSTYNAKVVEEIKQMDRQWLVESYAPNDMSAFDRIVADDFMITHSRGRVLNKAQKRADIVSNHSPLSPSSSAPSPDSAFKIEDSSVQVRVYKGAAISTGYIIEKDLSQSKNDRVYFTNTYLKRKGRWQVVASQLTRVPQLK